MNRSAQRYPADSLSLVTFALLVATGAVMPLALTPRSHGTTLRRLERHDRGNIHFWMAVSILGPLSVHLPLHWKWTVHRVRSRPRGSKRARQCVTLDVVGVVVLLVLIVAPLLYSTVEGPGNRREGDGAGPAAAG